MSTVRIDFNSKIGKIKPMHAVNNGPVYKFASDQRITNIDHFIAAGIPYARNHDASEWIDYGGEFVVDIYSLFPDFDADEELPESYNFHPTDLYLSSIKAIGADIFFQCRSVAFLQFLRK